MKLRPYGTTVACLLVLAGMAVRATAAEPFFETGAVRQPATKGERNAYPAIVRTGGGKLFAVWTMTEAKNPDGKIVGAFSADGGRTWGEPVTIIDVPGKLDADPNIILDGPRLLVFSTTVAIPNKIAWSEMWSSASEDDGRTWSLPREVKLPFKYFVGKRHIGLKLSNGTLALPASWDVWAQAGTPARTEGEMDLKSGVLLSADGGRSWEPHAELHIFEPKVSPGAIWGVAEPAIVELKNGDLFMLLRTGSDHLYQSRSRDGGRSWSAPAPSPLQGHNAPAALLRLDQKPEEVIVVWNNSPRERNPLSAAISADGGRTWSRPKNVAVSDGPAISYPGIAQDTKGVFVAVWQQQLTDGGRSICWARFNREWVLRP